MSSKGPSVILTPTQGMLAIAIAVIALSYLIYRFYFSGFFAGNFSVAGETFVVNASNKFVGILTKNPSVALDVNGSVNIEENLEVKGSVTIEENLEVKGSVTIEENLEVKGSVTIEEVLQIPVNYAGTVQEGAIQFSTDTNSLQVYKESDGWVEVGAAIPIAETEPGLVGGVDDPLNVTTFQNSFNGGTTTVDSEATFNSATGAAAENAIIRLTSDITCASTLTIPNKGLWIDLNGFTLTVPVSAAASIVCQQNAKNIYFSNGVIQYASTGTSGTSSALISASNCFLTIRNTTILHGEYAVLITGTAGNRLTFYTSGSTYTIVKARSSNNNVYGPIGLFGMATNDSYIYVRNCTFDTLAGDTYLNTATDRYTVRGIVRCANNTHLAGSCTLTGCIINPAHRLQAVFYSDVFSAVGARGTFRLNMDRNTIGPAGVVEQLIILIGFKPLNCFDSIYIMENTFERMDSNKGIMYVDATSGGSTDVFIFNNTIPPMKAVSGIAFESTYTREGNTVNVVTPSPHNFTVGYDVTLTGSVGGLSNGAYIIQTIVSPTEFTITDSVSGSATGTTIVIDNYATSTRKFVSKDGIVRGPSNMTSAYLQKYSI
jgi:hypothetical protein